MQRGDAAGGLRSLQIRRRVLAYAAHAAADGNRRKRKLAATDQVFEVVEQAHGGSS